mgnify:CR=1 FL=1
MGLLNKKATKHTHDDGTEHSHANGDVYHEHGKECLCGEARSIICKLHGDKWQKRYKSLTKYIR